MLNVDVLITKLRRITVPVLQLTHERIGAVKKTECVSYDHVIHNTPYTTELHIGAIANIIPGDNNFNELFNIKICSKRSDILSICELSLAQILNGNALIESQFLEQILLNPFFIKLLH